MANITWSKIEIGSALESVRAIGNFDDDNILIGTGDTAGDADIYLSSDRALTFPTKVELGLNSIAVSGISVINSTTALCALIGVSPVDNKIMKTINSGASWVEKTNIPALGFSSGNFQGIDVRDDGVGFAVAAFKSGLITKTIDGGENWTVSFNFNTTDGSFGGFKCIKYIKDQTWIAAFNDSGGGGIYISSNDGGSWSKLVIGGTYSINSIAYNNLDDTVYIGGSNDRGGSVNVWKSTNSTYTTYTTTNFNNSGIELVYALEYANGILFAGLGTTTGDGDVRVSDDGGDTWTTSLDSTTLEYIYSLKYIGNGVVLAGGGNTTGDGDVYRGVFDSSLIPKASKISDRYYQHIEVELFSPTVDASIYYTIDGSTPTTSSTLYTNPLWITRDITLKAISGGDGYSNSAILTRTYEIRDYNNRPDYNIYIYDSSSINFGVQGKTDILSEKRRHRTIDFIDGGVGEQFVNVKRTVNLTIDKITQEDRDDLYTLWSSQEAFYIETEKNEFIKVRYIAPTFTIAQDESYDDRAFYRGTIELKEA